MYPGAGLNGVGSGESSPTRLRRPLLVASSRGLERTGLALRVHGGSLQRRSPRHSQARDRGSARPLFLVARYAAAVRHHDATLLFTDLERALGCRQRLPSHSPRRLPGLVGQHANPIVEGAHNVSARPCWTGRTASAGAAREHCGLRDSTCDRRRAGGRRGGLGDAVG
jgi:hypothetical protein